jgi:hypothetical protein
MSMRLFKHLLLSVCFFFGSITFGLSQYTLTVESSVPAVAPGTVYRFYVDMVDPTDRMSAVFGNNVDTLTLSAPDGVFNTSYNGSWNASGINAAFLALFPIIADDTYATIGLEGPASESGIPNASDPSLVDDGAQPFAPFFTTDGATLLEVNTLIGASYYVLNTAENGLPDANLRVLIMQVTTTGAISGTLNYQVFPLGVGENQIQISVDFDGVGTFAGEVGGCLVPIACNYNPSATFSDGSCDFISCLAIGCTDPMACNYDPLAIYLDASCIYFNPPFDCDGLCINDADSDGICDELEIYGCTDSNASNYNPAATEDNGLCQTGLCTPDTDMPFFAYFPDSTFLSCDELMPAPEENMPVAGDFCTATVDIVITSSDGGFEYPFGCLQSYLCPRTFTATDEAGNSISEIQWFTVLDTEPPVIAYPSVTNLSVDQSSGETIPVAEAFVIDACDNSADWSYEDLVISDEIGLQIVERTYTAFDGCGNTSEFVQTISILTSNLGCMDVFACNYDASAETDDGFCIYPNLGEDCNGECLADADDDGVCDASEVDGCVDDTACNYDALATEDDGSCEFCSCTDGGTEGYGLAVDVVIAHTDGVLAGHTTYRLYITTPHTDDFLSAVSGDDLNPLNITSTTSFFQSAVGSVLGSNMNPLFYSSFPELEYDSWVTIGLDVGAGPNESNPQYIESTNFSWVSQFEAGGNLDIDDSVGGAWFVLDTEGTDNAYPDVNQRILIAQLTTDGNVAGTVNVQFFNHGDQNDLSRVTLSFEGLTGTEALTCGCTDVLACNYSADYDFDNGSCEYADPGYDCLGVCLDDDDGDGVCNPFELYGCTDSEACNFAPFYTEEDGSCFYGFEFYDCAGECLNDSDGDDVCDEFEIEGCTDPLACNFNPEATEDNGFCGGDQENDFCAGAFEIQCGSSIIANNEECVAVDGVPSCATSPVPDPSGGLWFSFEGTGDLITLTTCSELTTFDTYISVYEGGCGALTCVAGNDDQSEPFYDDLCIEIAFASTLEFISELGVNYLVMVCGAFAETGTFELIMDCVIPGCTEPSACNFDVAANVDDETCEYSSCAGCTDAFACNYDSLASIDDASCEYETCAGCMDAAACNFDSEATIPNEMCAYPDMFYDCFNNCVNDTDSDGVCDEFEVYGCMDSSASNYDIFATENDGSCVFCDLQVSLVELEAIVCHGDSSATLEILTENANNIILFYEVNGESLDGPVVSGLPVGNYTITVFDGPTCQAISNIVISEPDAVVLSWDVTDASCFGYDDGEVSLTFSVGNTENATYNFNDLETNLGQYLDVSPGDYVAFGVDGNGCISDDVSVQVTSPDELILEAVVSDVLCHGGNSGEAELNGLGGEGEYSYAFNGSEFSVNSVYTDLTVGDYDASLMDSNGCSFDMVVSVSEPEALSIILESVENSTADLNNGNIDISVVGGVPDFFFVWVNENGDFIGDTEDLSDIPGGVFTVTVTDENGCVASYPGIEVDEVVGVFELELMSFSMLPNPAHEHVVIQLDNVTQGAILLINDMSGRVVFEKRIASGELSIHVSVADLSSGLYSVRLHSGNRGGVLPLMIQR